MSIMDTKVNACNTVVKNTIEDVTNAVTHNCALCILHEYHLNNMM